METLNTQSNSVSMKWSVDNVQIDEFEATYLTLSFKVNYLSVNGTRLFASIDDEAEKKFETVIIAGPEAAETMYGEVGMTSDGE